MAWVEVSILSISYTSWESAFPTNYFTAWRLDCQSNFNTISRGQSCIPCLPAQSLNWWNALSHYMNLRHLKHSAVKYWMVLSSYTACQSLELQRSKNTQRRLSSLIFRGRHKNCGSCTTRTSAGTDERVSSHCGHWCCCCSPYWCLSHAVTFTAQGWYLGRLWSRS